MRRQFTTALLALCSIMMVHAQRTVEGTTYFLPRTALRLTFLIEKTTYTPGQFAPYAERYMKKTGVELNPSTTYRIINTKLSSVGVPDSAKQFTLLLDKKHSITTVSRDESGMLLAINAEGKMPQQPAPFIPARKPEPLNPKDFMNEDILTAGSTAKMAELCAQEIYDIRDSRDQLSRGKAESMPKDGQQLKLMLANLATQERGLLQVFEGTTVKDTIERVLTYIPTQEVSHQLLFRFSKRFGLIDSDDLSGTPYYIYITDEHVLTGSNESAGEQKKSKDDIGLNVNIPGKIKVALYEQEKQRANFEVYAAQFGKTENLSGDLFGKKQTTRIILNPTTGSIESIQTELVK